jgi:putative transposase
MPFKSRHTEDLLKGRVSVPGATYFVTWVTHNRIPFFTDEPNRQLARQHIAAINGSGDGIVMAGTVMPDHVHLLLELGARLPLGAVIAKTKAAITRASRSVKWQLNFFDHQLRTTDSPENYAFYIFMNPYCAKLCPLDRPWSGWISSKGMRWQFEEKLQEGQFPQTEWIGQAQRFRQSLPRGAD